MDRLVWIDCEMTGLDAASDLLLEVACLVTDSELNILGDGVDVVVSAPETALAGMDAVVQQMHATSGLTEAVRASTLTVADAERQVLDYIRDQIPDAGRAPLCGNSIATDRNFLARYMPALDSYLHYRMVDVSTVKELARRWYPRAYYAAPAKRGGHRALADIQESIDELRYYRKAIFVPQPGPTSEFARAAAQEITRAAGRETGTDNAGDDAGSPPSAPAGVPRTGTTSAETAPTSRTPADAAQTPPAAV
ncbi:oligoribonuclease [Protofrankia coriariae]|uniref:oligoribonuclease n=1 Tax=Protofrankia coriariae TaxID=1562887 RepID=UPI000A31E90F|nr:oligoribonuclease [Protofrankia coriariae]